MAHSDMFLIQNKMLTLLCGMFSTGLKWRKELDTQKLSFCCKLCFSISTACTRSDCASVILLVYVDKRDGWFCYWIWRTVALEHYFSCFAQSLRLPVLSFKVPQIVGRVGNLCRETFHSGSQINLYLHFRFSIFIRQNHAVIYYFK